jgi:hypothetical protein
MNKEYIQLVKMSKNGNRNNARGFNNIIAN